MEKSIKNFENESNLNPQQFEQKMKELNEKLNNKLNNLNSETEIEYIICCEYDKYNVYNHCDTCERNCHSPCNCAGNLYGRCINTIFDGRRCDECHCFKDRHRADNYHWIRKRRNKKKDNQAQINDVKKQKEERKNQYKKKINQQSNLEKQINDLNRNKNTLLDEKNKNLKEKEETEIKIDYIKNQITYIIIKLQRISEKVNDIAMNNNHSKT